MSMNWPILLILLGLGGLLGWCDLLERLPKKLRWKVLWSWFFLSLALARMLSR